jgi:site-specific DNA-methyltransferase (adenine-specific)/adenine-specific DNA-methyltransferase
LTADADLTLHRGDVAEFLPTLADGSVQLVVTSPPYNVGKRYEARVALDTYLAAMEPVLDGLVRVLAPAGSLCWQVGNFVRAGEVVPLDALYYPLIKRRGLKLRNRIVWHFEHGLHASRRFSGRYETLLWFTKSDDYAFNLDAVRVPAKYPGKRHFKGPNVGRPSGNPLGKNPSDLWRFVAGEWDRGVWEVPNVKANHPEKTAHPCQFPVELAERCVLAFTRPGEWVFDPFCGVGSALIAGLKHGRRVVGCEKDAGYVRIARERVAVLRAGELKVRELGKPVHRPTGREKVARPPEEWGNRAEV